MNNSALDSYENFYLSDAEVKECFLNTFQILSIKQQKIWQLLQWYATHYRQAFPSHTTIAEKVGCCRDTVVEAIKLFVERGWMTTIKRVYRSSLYFIKNFLLNIDTRKNETFALNPTENPTEIPTLYNTYSMQEKNRMPKEVGAVQNLNSEKQQILQEIGISLPKDVFCLTRFSLRALSLAYDDYRTRQSPSPIRKLAAWITSRCKQYTQK